jgi:hypothetical protein
VLTIFPLSKLDASCYVQRAIQKRISSKGNSADKESSLIDTAGDEILKYGTEKFM